jgi:uncharacterized membrane protein YozB (DUF420 family)
MSMNIGSTFNYLNSFLVQESISLMFVALGLTILGIGYARIKNKEFLQLHRWVMRGAVILTMIAIFFVMFPSLFIYYTTLSNSVLSGFSILQIVHSVEGVPAVILSVIYLFNDLPQPTKKWMKITAVLWIVSIVLGAVVYYTMPS